MRTEIPAASAVARLADPHNRVGKLVIPEGRQLDDITDVKTNEVTDGIFTLISDGHLRRSRRRPDVRRRRRSAQGGRRAATPVGADRAATGRSSRSTALGNDHRRLEGLIAPGTWNVDPSASPQEILATLIGASADQYTKRRAAGHRARP